MQKDEEIAYQETLDYLYRFVDYSLVRNFRNAPGKFDLKRMVALLEKLDNPHQKYGVVHVAGTKGKGSTSALIASALRAAGHRVGFYSSPHLQEFTERFQINGAEISKGELVTLVSDFRPIIEQIENITWFEITTAMGFEWFARQKVDIAVIEVGLGGRLDATNVVDPLVSVITALSMDHMGVLGDTLAKIAYEKAGIVKPGKPVIVSRQEAEAREVVEQIAAERGSPLTLVEKDYRYRLINHSLEGQAFVIEAVDKSASAALTMPLLGDHQLENAVTAYAALHELIHQGWKISESDIQKGFSTVIWPGRFEILRPAPPLIVDSAHNRDSARRLRQTIDDYLPGKPVLLMFGASEDKDIQGMLDELMPRVDSAIFTQSIHPRAMPAEKMVEMAASYGKPVEAIQPVEKALEVALQKAGDHTVILAAGSLFIAAAVSNVWQQMKKDLPV